VGNGCDDDENNGNNSDSDDGCDDDENNGNLVIVMMVVMMMKIMIIIVIVMMIVMMIRMSLMQFMKKRFGKCATNGLGNSCQGIEGNDALGDVHDDDDKDCDNL